MLVSKRGTSFPLDDIFGDHGEYISHLMSVYTDLYKLPTLNYSEDVTEEQMRYIRARRHFVLLAIYRLDRSIFLYRELSARLNWSLPGGSVWPKETLFDAAARLAAKISPELRLGEIEPIAIVQNDFSSQNQAHTDTWSHRGVAFMARARNPDCLDPTVTGQFVQISENELERITRYANQKVVRHCSERLRRFHLPVSENEVAASHAAPWRYKVHNNIVKRYVLTDDRKRRSDLNRIFDELVVRATSVLDPSCGDSRFLNSLVERNPHIRLAVANDIAFETAKRIQIKNDKVIFTNHDLLYLPFAPDTFDICIMSNTLHHFPNGDKMATALEHLFHLSRRLVLFEIENPKRGDLFPYLLNRYWYHAFLGDQGVAYLSQDEFRGLVTKLFASRASIQFSEFVNVQGRYMLAVVDKEQAPHLEVEDKRTLLPEREESLVQSLRDRGFRETGTIHEEDQYFSDLQGSFVERKTCFRIRLTENGTRASIDYKDPSEPGANESHFAKIERNLPIRDVDAKSAKEILECVNFVPYIEVKKERTIWERTDTQIRRRVCIDRLEGGGGSFAEFEVVSHHRDVSEQILRRELERMITELGCADLDRAVQPYRDVVARGFARRLNPRGARIVLFDLDGTIVPTEELFFSVWRATSAARYSADFTFEEYSKYELEQDGGLYHFLRFNDRLKAAESRDEYMASIYEAYRKALTKNARSKRFEKSFDPVRGLQKRGFRIGLVTTSRRQYVDEILKGVPKEERPHFEVIICRADVKNRKPHPEAYQLAIQRLKVRPDEVIAIEDSKRGAQAAVDAGLHCVLINNAALQLNGWSQELDLPVCESLAQCCLLLGAE